MEEIVEKFKFNKLKMDKAEVGIEMKVALEMEIRLASEYIESFSKKIKEIDKTLDVCSPLNLTDKIGQKLVDILKNNLQKFKVKQQKKQEKIFSSNNLQKFVDDVDYTRKNSAKAHLLTAELVGQASSYNPQVEKQFLEYLIEQNIFNRNVFEQQLNFVNDNFVLKNLEV